MDGGALYFCQFLEFDEGHSHGKRAISCGSNENECSFTTPKRIGNGISTSQTTEMLCLAFVSSSARHRWKGTTADSHTPLLFTRLLSETVNNGSHFVALADRHKVGESLIGLSNYRQGLNGIGYTQEHRGLLKRLYLIPTLQVETVDISRLLRPGNCNSTPGNF